MGPPPWSRYANTTLNHDKVSIYCALLTPQRKQSPGLRLHNRGEYGQDQDWISCRILAIFLDLDCLWLFIFEKNWIRTGSGYFFVFYNETFLRVIQDVTNDCTVVFFAMIFIFTKKSKWFCQHVLHLSQSMITPVTLSQFLSGEVEVVGCFYIAGMLLGFVVLSAISCVCVLCCVG